MPGAWFNLPAVLILGLVTIVLVIGIRESATSNTVLVLIKLGVILFVIAIGVGYVSSRNWFDIPGGTQDRRAGQPRRHRGRDHQERGQLARFRRDLGKLFGYGAAR